MTTKREIAYAFKAAKEFLAHSQGEGDSYICLAIMEASRRCRITERVSQAAQDIVAARIAPYDSFQQWLIHTHPKLKTAFERDYMNRNRKLQATRHAWVDSLIKEFSTK